MHRVGIGRWESVRWTRGICREDADLSVLVFGRWIVADEIKEGGEDPDSARNLDDSVVIFKVVYLLDSLFFRVK